MLSSRFILVKLFSLFTCMCINLLQACPEAHNSYTAVTALYNLKLTFFCKLTKFTKEKNLLITEQVDRSTTECEDDGEQVSDLERSRKFAAVVAQSELFAFALIWIELNTKTQYWICWCEKF